MINLIQWNGVNVTPADDAALYAHFDPRSGIISGCQVTFLSANQLNITSGRGYICGRQFIVQQEVILATLATSGTMQGRLLVQVDLSNTETPIEFVTQAAATLPDLQQDDLNDGGTVYQLPLATYTVDNITLSNFTALNQTLGSLLDAIYPIGSIYQSTNETSPETLFGGTWSQIQGQFLLGASSTYPAGSTGGEAKHTLTSQEIPSHYHNLPIDYGSHSGSSRGISSWVDNATASSDGSYKTGNTGGGQAHNNMPPYMAVYIWQRTA